MLGNTVNGASFLGQTSPVGNNIYKIRFINDSVGVAVGQSNLILYTKNKGVTWTVKSTAGNNDLLDICTIGRSIFWAAGTNGYIQKSTDAGNSWTTIIDAGNQGQEYKDISFINENLGWFVGESGVNIYDNRPKTNNKKLSLESQFKIYPNPNSTGVLNIDNTAHGVVSIYNTIGQKMLTQNMDASNTTINISAMQKGIYLVIFQSNGAQQTTKLIVE